MGLSTFGTGFWGEALTPRRSASGPGYSLVAVALALGLDSVTAGGCAQAAIPTFPTVITATPADAASSLPISRPGTQERSAGLAFCRVGVSTKRSVIHASTRETTRTPMPATRPRAVPAAARIPLPSRLDSPPLSR